MPPEPDPDALSTAVRRGARWIVAGQLVSQLISLGALAVLYRLIAPEAFGLFGMAIPFVMVPRTLATLGLSAAAVQRHELTNDERALLFWMQAALGVLVTFGTYLIARPAAQWYGVTEVAPLIQALSATVLVASLAATHQALFERRLQLPRVTVVRIVGQTLGAIVAVAAALRGWGTQALVVQQYGELVALLVASWIAEPWLPRWPRQRTGAWRELAAFSGLFSLSSLLFVITQNIDKLLLGLWLGDTPAGQAVVGAYTQAYNLMMRVVYVVTAPMTGILLSSLSRAKHDTARFTELTTNTYRLTANLLLPASVGLWLVAEDAMSVLGGPEWRDAGLLLSALAPVLALQGWINLCGSVLAARGKAALLCFGAFITLLVTTQAIVAGFYVGEQMWPLPFGGALGAATGLAIGTTLILGLPYIATTFVATGVPPVAVFRTALAPLRASLLMGLVVALAQLSLRDASPGLRLLPSISAGIAVYAVLSLGELRWLRKISQAT